jgi:hypothetical protein
MPLQALQQSLEKHYTAESAAADSDLDCLHGNPEFNDLMKKHSAKKP